MTRVGDIINTENSQWRFSEISGTNFDRHIKKSIPFYEEGHELILELSDYFVKENSICYDLGCSTGHLSASLAKRHKRKHLKIIGIDKEENMVREAGKNCSLQENVEMVVGDISDFRYIPSDLVVAYYTVQFLALRERPALFEKIYSSLKPGGALVLFEKILAPDAQTQEILSGLYHEHKLKQGFSGEEIINKSRSLKGILVSQESKENLRQLENAGFTKISPIFRHLCFEGLLAIR